MNKKTGNTKPIQTVADLRKLFCGDPQELERFYEQHRAAFILFASRYGLEEADVLDAYQDAVIALYEQVVEGRLKELSSSIKTYLFAIGKNKLVDRLRAKGRELKQLDPVEIDQVGLEEWEEKIELSHRQLKVKAALDQLGGPCQQLLLLFYYQRYSIEAIRLEMGYHTDNVVKANKSRCMKKLRTLIKDLYD